MRAVLLLLLLLVAGWAPADELGRLFFSAAERARLDTERVASPLPEATEIAAMPPTPAEVTVDTPAVPAPPVSVNGLVLRAHGPSTAWINGTPATGRDLVPRDGREIQIARDAIEVRDPLTRARVKPGQIFDPDAGRVVEGYARPSSPAPVSP